MILESLKTLEIVSGVLFSSKIQILPAVSSAPLGWEYLKVPDAAHVVDPQTF